METKHIEVNPVRRVGCGVQEMLEPEGGHDRRGPLAGAQRPGKEPVLAVMLNST